MFVFVILVLD